MDPETFDKTIKEELNKTKVIAINAPQTAAEMLDLAQVGAPATIDEEEKHKLTSHHQNAKKVHTKAEVGIAKKQKRQKYQAHVQKLRALKQKDHNRTPSPRPLRGFKAAHMVGLA